MQSLTDHRQNQPVAAQCAYLGTRGDQCPRAGVVVLTAAPAAVDPGVVIPPELLCTLHAFAYVQAVITDIADAELPGDVALTVAPLPHPVAS